MWRDVNNRKDFSLRICPKCVDNSSFVISPIDFSRCQNCFKFKHLFKCSKTTCKFQIILCRTCDLKESPQQSSVKWNKKCLIFKNLCFGSGGLNLKIIFIFSALLVMFVAPIFYNCSIFSGTSEDLNVNVIKNLKKLYHLQKNETWYHFMGVLEKNKPTVKTITFLHGEESRTLDCLVSELVSLYTNNKNIPTKEITFSHFEDEVKDYGIVLEYYRPVIKRFRIFITNLNSVSGNIARIFHTLCDEISSDIKPSLFIFTLKYNKGIKNLKPVERATTILKKAWNDLPENEIFPLLSRVIKHVVDIIPEEEILC